MRSHAPFQISLAASIVRLTLAALVVFLCVVCILMAPNAQAQTQECPKEERSVSNADGTACFPNDKADIADDCIARGWTINGGFAFMGELVCDINAIIVGTEASEEMSIHGCSIHGADKIYPACAKIFGDPPEFPNKAGQEEKVRIKRLSHQQRSYFTADLLKTKLNILWVDENGWTQLHWAAISSDFKAVRRLLRMGAHPNIAGKSDGSKFSETGKQRFKQLGIERRSWKNMGDTPLQLALHADSYVIASILIANDADVNAQETDGSTPLHWAAFNNSPEIAKLLIGRGAWINVQDKNGFTPLHMAAWRNAPQVAKLLVGIKSDSSKVTGNIGGFVVVGGGVAVDMENKFGMTPLHFAARENAAEVAKLLIDNGADVNAKNEWGDTPLHRAAANNAAEVAKLLIARRYEYDGYDYKNKRRRIIIKGADVNAKHINGNTPLHYAAKKKAAGIVKLLIANGADVNAKDDDGYTPLNLATQRGAVKIAKLLLENGATK